MDFPLSQAASLDLKDGRFTDGVPGLYPASIIPSETSNDIIDEILAVQTAGGLTKDEFNKTQLKTAIQNMIEARVGDYAIDTGTANAYVVAMNPVATTWAGLEGSFRVAHANTGPSTLNAGPGARALVNDVGLPLVLGDLPPGALVSWVYDAPTDKCIIKGLVPSQALTKTQADLLYAPIAGFGARAVCRHSIQYGPTTGNPAVSNLIPQSQIGNTLATGVTAKFSVKPTFLSIANGFNSDGSQNDLNIVLNADLTLTNLSANTTNYIVYDGVNNALLKTTVSDTDTKGGAPGTTSGLYTLDYENWINYLGNGASAVAAKHLVIAEVDTNGTAVTAIRCRAYRRECETPLTASTGSTETVFQHNIGTMRCSIKAELECVTVDLGYAAGVIKSWTQTANGGALVGEPTSLLSKNSALMSVNVTWTIVPSRTSTSGNLTTITNWNARLKIKGDY